MPYLSRLEKLCFIAETIVVFLQIWLLLRRCWFIDLLVSSESFVFQKCPMTFTRALLWVLLWYFSLGRMSLHAALFFSVGFVRCASVL